MTATTELFRRALASVAAVGGTVLASWLWLRYAVPNTYPVYYHETLRADAAADVAIADPTTALTFARVGRGSDRQVLLVRSYRDGVVTGVAVADARDPITAFAEYGYLHLQALVENAAPAALVEVAADDLGPAFDGHPANIAMGTNYPEHAAETTVGAAFLFPKIVRPTGPHTSVATGSGLLDYEVELGLVPLTDLHEGDTNPPYMGLVLSNDWTDRETLIRGIHVGNITDGAGFTDAKSRPGYLSTGDLFVIPADWQVYYRGLRIELYVNGQLRQRGTPADQLWDATAMLEEIWAKADTTWDHHGAPVPLTPQPRTIAAGTVLQCGTPEGVVFRPPSKRQIVLGSLAHLAAFGRDSGSFFESAANLYIREAKEDKAYLQPGDTVISRAEGLGRIVTHIVAGPPNG